VLSVDDCLYYLEDALDGIAQILGVLGDDLANTRPELPGANSPYAIATHCLGVMEYWGGYRAAGRTIERDRPAEFRASGPVDGLIQRISAAKRQLRRDLLDLDPAAPPYGNPDPDDVDHPVGRSKGGVVMHIYEELARHRGQLEITRDLLQASGTG
jgi:hypothetical protein